MRRLEHPISPARYHSFNMGFIVEELERTRSTAAEEVVVGAAPSTDSTLIAELASRVLQREEQAAG